MPGVVLLAHLLLFRMPREDAEWIRPVARDPLMPGSPRGRSPHSPARSATPLLMLKLSGGHPNGLHVQNKAAPAVSAGAVSRVPPKPFFQLQPSVGASVASFPAIDALQQTPSPPSRRCTKALEETSSPHKGSQIRRKQTCLEPLCPSKRTESYEAAPSLAPGTASAETTQKTH